MNANSMGLVLHLCKVGDQMEIEQTLGKYKRTAIGKKKAGNVTQILEGVATVNDGDHYYYARVTSINKNVTYQGYVSREMKGLGAESFYTQQPLSEGELEVGDSVNFKPPHETSYCPSEFWIEESNSPAKKRSSSTVEVDMVDLSDGRQLCYESQEKASDEAMETESEKEESESESESESEEEKFELTPLKISTWNINHLSDNSERRREKRQAMADLLEGEQPDILVLQEVNLFTGIDTGTISKIGAKTYQWRMGPRLKTGNSVFLQRYGYQYEYYPIMFSETLECVETFTILTHESCDEIVTGGEVEWVEHRPLVIRKMRIKKLDVEFMLGIVHTSPGFDVEKSSHEYVRAMQARYPEISWMLAGDWYVKDDAPVPFYGRALGWSPILGIYAALLRTPGDDITNFPDSGSGMTADYFVTDSTWELERCEVVSYSQLQTGRAKRGVRGQGWKDNRLSDHAPVSGRFKLQYLA